MLLGKNNEAKKKKKKKNQKKNQPLLVGTNSPDADTEQHQTALNLIESKFYNENERLLDIVSKPQRKLRLVLTTHLMTPWNIVHTKKRSTLLGKK